MTEPEVIARDLKKFASTNFGAPGDRAFEAAVLIERQKAAIDRVGGLHRAVPVQFEEYSVCGECLTQTWPCATILALGSADRGSGDA